MGVERGLVTGALGEFAGRHDRVLALVVLYLDLCVELVHTQNDDNRHTREVKHDADNLSNTVRIWMHSQVHE